MKKGTPAAGLVSVVAVVFWAQHVSAAGSRVLLLNQQAATTHTVSTSDGPDQSVSSSGQGTLSFAVNATTGDTLLIRALTDTQPPAPPPFVDAVEVSPGCIQVSWAPSGDPTVVGYIVDYGTRSVAGGEASQYDVSLDVRNAIGLQVCSLSAPVYYIAVRARNHIALTSPWSVEQVVEITQTPVGITSFGAAQEGDAVVAHWQIWSDESIRALELYRTREDGRPEGARRLAILDPWQQRFVDADVRPSTDYGYQLVVVAATGVRIVSVPVRVRTRDVFLELDQNVPNPFNPATSISWVVPERLHVRLDVFDVTGAHVATLHDGVVDAGRHSVRWDGRSSTGRPVASGTYFYLLRTPRGQLKRKMLLVK